MVKEILIGIYLFVVKCLFTFFKLVPLKRKTTFIVSFGQNSLFIYNEMKRQNIPGKVVVLCSKGYLLNDSSFDRNMISFETFNPINMLKSYYHLATSKRIIIDNYYGFLSAVKFKSQVQCFQLWHAAGAIKTFGHKDHSTEARTNRARKRFQKVYKQFHKIVVGSEAMANIFIEAFQLPPENILRAGIPRTDLFYDQVLQTDARARLQNEINSGNKKIILYAPTYRDNEFENYKLQIDIGLMQQELGDRYILLLKLHPALAKQADLDPRYSEFAFDVSENHDINELLLITDVLITDYSSVPYEFSLLNKPMIFFPYDLEDYQKSRGLWGDYNTLVPGPIVFSTKEIVNLVQENSFDLSAIQRFARQWNEYSDGNSSREVVDYMFYPEQTTGLLNRDKDISKTM